MNIKTRVLWSYGILLTIYSVGTLVLPAPAKTLKQYHITLGQIRLLDLTIIVLYGAIWLCALYGFYTLYEYLAMIKKNKDGKALAKITIGIGLLAYWLPVTSTISLFTNYLVVKHPSYAAPVDIFQNYLTLIVPLVAFIFISLGARQLSELTKLRMSFRDINVLIITLAVIAVTYAHLLVTTNNQLNSTYHMPSAALLLTLALPYIYMWSIGLLAVYEIHHYRLKAPGVVYRKSWHKLALGLGSIITVTIFLQYLVTISAKLTRLSLSWILLLVYVLLVMLAVSYVLIAMGVRTLKRIEEV